MESLDKEWIFHGNIQTCEQFEKTPNTLGLKNMAGVFILVGAGIIGGKIIKISKLYTILFKLKDFIYFNENIS